MKTIRLTALSQEREKIGPEPKQWIKPSRRGRTKGAFVYIDGMNWDDALWSLPECKDIKDAKDLPDISRVRVRRYTMAPGKIVLTLKVLPEEGEING